MQAPLTYRPVQRLAQSRRGLKLLGLALAVLAVVVGSTATQQPIRKPTPPRLSQGHAAWQFLRAVLRADYATAYGRLAPEVRRAVSLARFAAAARSLWKSGQQRGQEIKLYKLGMRLGEGGASRLFYAFAFAADSAVAPPPAVLEVTFRDTAARAVLGFGLRPARLVLPTRALPAPSRAAKPR